MKDPSQRGDDDSLRLGSDPVPAQLAQGTGLLSGSPQQDDEEPNAVLSFYVFDESVRKKAMI